MREISIVEIHNPLTKKYESVNDSIKNGIFDIKNCEFLDPQWNERYSIYEAAKKGLFKITINTIPTRLIAEKKRVVETYSLIDVIDPQNYEQVLTVDEAIDNGIIDLKLGIYKNEKKNTEMELIDAIEKNFVHANLIRSISEFLRSTYVESFELLDEEVIPETLVTVEDENQVALLDDSGIQVLNPNDPLEHFYEQTKFTEFNQTEIKQKYKNDVFTIGLLIDSDLNKTLSDIFSHETTYSYVIERNKLKFFTNAIEQGLVILPNDNHDILNNLIFAIDKLSGNFYDYNEAIEEGLIDEKRFLYKNTDTDEYMGLFEALKQGLICIDDNIIDDLNLSDIHTVFNPLTGTQIPFAKAVQEGIFNLRQRTFVDPKNRKRIPINDAIEKSLIVLKHDFDEALIIQGVINPLTGERLSLDVAIDKGLINYFEGTFSISNDKFISLEEAHKNGYLITSERRIEQTSSNESINNDTSPCSYKKFYDNLCNTTNKLSAKDSFEADTTIDNINMNNNKKDSRSLFSTPIKPLSVKV
jgi:hypothetical protein